MPESINESDYGTYDPNSPVYRPISERLTVDAGAGSKGRAKKNTVVTMTAMPSFIQRMKPTKVGKHKNKNVDGIVEDHFTDLADESDDHLDAIDRHLGSMLEDPDGAIWDLLD